MLCLAFGNLFHILDCLAQLEWRRGGGTMTWSHRNLQLNRPCFVDPHIPMGSLLLSEQKQTRRGLGYGGKGEVGVRDVKKNQWIY